MKGPRGSRPRRGSTPHAGVVSFKASDSFLEAMKGVPNRSEFIRAAVLTALESACPLCKGTGILTPNQKRHWQAFAHDHSLQECEECHELRLICESGVRQAPRQAQGPEQGRGTRPALSTSKGGLTNDGAKARARRATGT